MINSLIEDAASCIASLERLRAKARAAGGSLVIESAPMEIKKAIDAWSVPRESASLMQRIKHQLDPVDTFSPGRFKSVPPAVAGG